VALLAAVAAGGTLAVGTSASAAILSPPSFDFGEQQVGTTSAPGTFSLSVQCQNFSFELFVCLAGETLKTSVSASPPFAVQSTDCPSELVGLYEFPTSCTIKVVFQPTVGGPVSGTLNTGGPTAELRGTGLAIAGAGGSGSQTGAIPSTPSNQLHIAKPKLDKRHGTATLTVTVPGPGTLGLAGKGIAVPPHRRRPGVAADNRSGGRPGEAADQAEGQGEDDARADREGHRQSHADLHAHRRHRGGLQPANSPRENVVSSQAAFPIT
jgi:hypothetical protein